MFKMNLSGVAVLVLVLGVDNVVGHEPSLLNVRLGVNRSKVVAVLRYQRIIPKDNRIVQSLLVVLNLPGGVNVRPAVGPERKQELNQRIVSCKELVPRNPSLLVPVLTGERIGEDLRIGFHVICYNALVFA